MLLRCASKFQIIAGLKYSFLGNLHVRVFLTYKTRIMTSSNDFTTSRAGTGSLPSFFISTHFFFQESWLSGLSWILIFQPNFIFFRIFLDFLVSVNIHVIKIITWDLTDVWHIIFFLLSYKHFIVLKLR